MLKDAKPIMDTLRVRMMELSTPTFQIVNVVATSELGREIDFKKVCDLPGFIYDHTKYNGKVAYLKDGQMKGKVSVFNSGKLISVGTRSEDEASHDLKHAVMVLTKAGDTSVNMRVRNIVALADFGKMLDIERIARHVEGAIYEPEQFPGVILRPKSLAGLTILLFASGKAIIAGLRSSENISSIGEEILQLISS